MATMAATEQPSTNTPSVSKLTQSLRSSIRLGPPPAIKKAPKPEPTEDVSESVDKEEAPDESSVNIPDRASQESLSPKPRRDSALAANGKYAPTIAHALIPAVIGIDITRELKIEAKRKELKIKHEGRSQLQKHVDSLRDNSKRKVDPPPANELEARLRRQQEKVKAEEQTQAEEANTSELHKAFRLRASIRP
eukprot:m.17063 g.17063  ORF g.17063 m.17063 type:complete len:193 (-) comp10640_c0_seq1:18-596(-)